MGYITNESSQTEVLRVNATDVAAAFADHAPSIHVIKGDYIAYDPNDPTTLRRYKHTDVVRICKDTLGRKDSADTATEIISPTIGPATTILVAPDHWDRRLPARHARFAEQLSVLPFSIVIHSSDGKKVTSKKAYRKLIPPKAAAQLMMEDRLIEKLSPSDILLLPGSSNSAGGDHASGLDLGGVTDDGIADALRGLTFSAPMRRRKRSSKRSSKRKSRKSRKRSTRKRKGSSNKRRRSTSRRRPSRVRLAARRRSATRKFAQILQAFKKHRARK